MKIWLHNTLQGLIPLYPSDYEEKKKLKIGHDYEATIVKPRNLGFHKKFFALLNIGYSNQDYYQSFELYRSVKIMECGYYVTVKLENNREIYLPKSISFSNMKQDEFEKLYSSMVQKIIIDLHITEETLEQEIINFM